MDQKAPARKRPTLGIDLGGTRVKAGLVLDGKVAASVVRNLSARDRTEDG
ncbi:MAG: hypothetical protein GXP54_04125, partial [Deltaproteobacteria bacterium]|nr:hypothetical protein [Deltaproteobacteria bacterium]